MASVLGENPSLERGRSEATICEVLDRVAQAADPARKVWSSEVLPNQQCLKILGSPFGHPEFVAWRSRSRNMSLCQTFRLHGSFCCIAQVPGQIICSEWSTPSRCNSSLRCTIRDCGSACVNFWELQLTCATTLPEVLLLFLSFLEDWV